MAASAGKEKSYTLFQEPWWLDLVAPDQWKEAVVEKGGQIIARMPYILREGALGLRICDHPAFTNTMGPWIAPPAGKYSKQLSTATYTIQELVRQLPKSHYFEHCLHYSLNNWLPYYWLDYQLFLSYTLIIPDLSSPEAVWDQMQPRIRNNVRKAEDRLGIRENLDLDLMAGIIKQTYDYRSSREKFCLDTLKRIDEECGRRDARLSLFAVDGKGDIRAVSYIVYDDRSAHFLLNGVDRRFNDSHVNSFIIWEGIKRCCGKTREFNFHGNIHPDVFAYFLKFGARLQQFFKVSKSSRRVRFCRFMERAARRLRLMR